MSGSNPYATVTNARFQVFKLARLPSIPVFPSEAAIEPSFPEPTPDLLFCSSVPPLPSPDGPQQRGPERFVCNLRGKNTGSEISGLLWRLGGGEGGIRIHVEVNRNQ